MGGLSQDDIKERLDGIWDLVWHHDLENDVSSALEILTQNGTFN